MSGPFDIFGLGADPEKPQESPARKAQIASARALPNRFYEDVTVFYEDGGFLIHLDGKPVRTPARQILKVADRPVAQKLADEWQAQKNKINPKNMPMTRLVNSALDGVANTMVEVREEVVRFSETDLLCYRAEGPDRLVERQNTHWDPVMIWMEERYGCSFKLVGGVMHVSQEGETIERVREIVDLYDNPLKLAGLHSMTSLLGSCILALAVADGFLLADHSWKLAHIDEDWNREQWGGDKEAEERRAYRWQDMKAASFLVTAVG